MGLVVERLVLPDPEAVAAEAAGRFVAFAADAIATSGRFTVVLAGGSTPRRLYQLLATPPQQGAVAWQVVHIYFGDERFVPPDHPDSNYAMAKAALLDHVPIPQGNIHPFPTWLPDPDEAAARYQAELQSHLGAEPAFDLVLLGLGEDGHTASLFPGDPLVTDPPAELVAVVRNAPKPPPVRLTLTLHAFAAARQVLFLATGAHKRAALRCVFDETTPVTACPAKGVRPAGGRVTWLVDEAAAG